ncbi:hypothetical protein SDC9_163909 [bioreactor metagenome]|uniref:Secretion system C-terminal sorting domain-containing protein n=1 Tax=bioreactor metagenome TaxID=1076179 RepID=A0A645FXD3_9ZZZZ
MTSIYDYSETDYFISNTTNIITIMTSENINDFTYEIFNLLGTKLSEGHSNEKYLEINAKNFPKGLYCIKLKYLTKTVFHKIIIY